MAETLTYTGTIQPPLWARRQMGWQPYLPEPGLVEAVNLALFLERPLLLKGVPGCGKSSLAQAVAYEFGQRYGVAHGLTWPYEHWRIKSTSRARDGLYTFDGVRRLRDAQMAALGQSADEDKVDYVYLGPLGRAMAQERRAIVLIDEIDRADIDFPNDLLVELEERRFYIEETGEWVEAQSKPIVFVTSNDTKALPHAFLRRCLFYYIEFPAQERLWHILAERYPDLSPEMVENQVRGGEGRGGRDG